MTETIYLVPEIVMGSLVRRELIVAHAFKDFEYQGMKEVQEGFWVAHKLAKTVHGCWDDS